MDLSHIRKLGDPILHEACKEIRIDELMDYLLLAEEMSELIRMHREEMGFGQAIAAPQVGHLKRLIVVHSEKPLYIFNPYIFDLSNDMKKIIDDCMSFPDIKVRLKRHNSCRIRYRDHNWKEKVMELKGEMSFLLQHEYDHLEGILAIDRSLDKPRYQYQV